jgi:hypothetical protein
MSPISHTASERTFNKEKRSLIPSLEIKRLKIQMTEAMLKYN